MILGTRVLAEFGMTPTGYLGRGHSKAKCKLSILRLLPGSATRREIAAPALFLSINAVEAYNKILYRKLDVGGRADAVRAARRLGLV